MIIKFYRNLNYIVSTTFSILSFKSMKPSNGGLIEKRNKLAAAFTKKLNTADSYVTPEKKI